MYFFNLLAIIKLIFKRQQHVTFLPEIYGSILFFSFAPNMHYHLIFVCLIGVRRYQHLVNRWQQNVWCK